MIDTAFARQAAPALGVGFLLAFGSSAGQTYFIALFAAEIRSDLNLSHGAFGSLYTVATIASAAALLWVGRLADRFDLPLLGALTLVGLSASALLMASALTSIALGLAIFGLRLFGQGLMSHLCMTAMGRWFSAERGRAVSIAALGYPAGEAALPAVVATTLLVASWRDIWLGAAVVMLVILLPLLLFLGRLVSARGLDGHRNHTAETLEQDGVRSWSRTEVLKDPRFFTLLPGLLAPPFIITGVLFHQVHLVATKSWTLSAFAACYPLYAASATVVALVCGRLIDRFGSAKLLPFYLLPLAAGLALLSLSDAFHAAPVFMVLIGATAGGTTVILGALWAEIYGTAHLGAIRSLSYALLVLSTAISPGLMGWLIDHGVRLETQLLTFSIYVVGCALTLSVIRPSLMTDRSPS